MGLGGDLEPSTVGRGGGLEPPTVGNMSFFFTKTFYLEPATVGGPFGPFRGSLGALWEPFLNPLLSAVELALGISTPSSEALALIQPKATSLQGGYLKGRGWQPSEMAETSLNF